MFEQLFRRSKALARQRTGPLAGERLAYLTHLAQQGMARATRREAALYLLIVAHQLRLAQRPAQTIPLAEVQRRATRWANRPDRKTTPEGIPHARQRFFGTATAWLRFLGRLQEPSLPPSPYADQVAAFADYLRRDRGLSSHTIRTHCQYLQSFLHHLDLPPEALPQVTLAQIDRTFQDKIARAGYARSTIHHHADALRAFFRFAQQRGWCPPGLAEGIHLPRLYRHETLPLGPSWDLVQRLLAKTEGDRPAQIRDRALLLLLATYGLRAGEVVRLRLEDLDWEHELLTVVRSKSFKTQTYPLCRTVGDAILRYLREVRPRSAHRQVFIRWRAPFTPMSRSALTCLVGNRFQALVGHSYGPHALRRACATRLLEQGLTLKEIGDHLGHSHPDATRLYAKVDLPHLRRVAEGIDLTGLEHGGPHPLPLDARVDLAQLAQLADIDLGDLL
jgi:site-specific recombinase XerD